MQIDTIVIPVEEAKERLAEYQQAVAKERNAEDVALAAGYRAAARGLPVIQLSHVIAAGGCFDDGLPRLAVVRADAERCSLTIERWSRSLVYASSEDARNRGALVGRCTVRVPQPVDWPTASQNHRPRRASTVVPIVPPRHRPRGRARLGRYHVLWEVESWTLEPPKDPALLRHIRGDLWAVLATWDLTDLERAVLAARR